MLAQKIARLLLAKKAVKINLDQPFVWTSGWHSPIYCDNRALTTDVAARETITAGFLEVIEKQKLEFEVVAGVATGAITWGMLVADRLGKPFCYIRPDPRDHGTAQQVEGAVNRGAKMLVIEDLFSTAGSTVKAAAAARREVGAEIVGVIAISTYEFDEARKQLAEAQLEWWTLTNFSALVAELQIPANEKKTVLDFAKDPASWSERVAAKN